MSYFASSTGYGWNAGHFLVDDETCIRVTMNIVPNVDQMQTRGTRKIIPAGAVIPYNNEDAVGILYEDIDVTDIIDVVNAAVPGSVVIQGTIYGDRLPAPLSEDTTEGGTTTPGAASVLTGIKVVQEPTITRPYKTTI